MYFQRQTNKYNYYRLGNKFLIGVSPQISKEEARLLLDSPMLMYEQNVYSKILRLEHKDRQIIMNALDKWEKGRNKEDSFVGLYWDIVLDYILAMYDMTTADLAEEMLKMRCFKGYTEKAIRDNIETMRSNKKSVQQHGQELVRKICYCCKITEEIVRTGKGILYYVEGGKEYTTEQVDAYCEGHDTVILKEMIATITGVEKNEIKEFPIQIAIQRKRLENKICDFLDIILDEMIGNRE